MNAYPGVERILNTLDERRVRERVRISSAALGTAALASLWNLDSGPTLASILLGATVSLGLVCALNSFRLESSMPMRSNSFPLLSLHAPTLHDSALDRVMTDLLVAHLDPETAGAWDVWMKSLAGDVRSDQSAASAVEHLLQALHLNHLGLLDENGLLSETKRVFKVSAIDGLISIYAESSIQPHHPLDVELDRSGTVESLGQLLDDSVILWIGLAWPDSASGPHPVQVTLRSEEGVTLTSTVVRTTLASGMQPESMGHRMSDAASEVRRIALSLAD